MRSPSFSTTSHPTSTWSSALAASPTCRCRGCARAASSPRSPSTTFASRSTRRRGSWRRRWRCGSRRRGGSALHARTEGWITGLQLAALSLRRTLDRDRFIASFAGDHRHVADYLMDEVLRRLPPQVQEFLLATSVLRRLSGDLCDAVTGGSGSDAMLEQLAEDNLFVQRLDEQRRWYRYHALFAELLRHRLAARDPAAAAALNRRAAAWFDERGLVPDAIHHALAGGDTELASRLVERHGTSCSRAASTAPSSVGSRRCPTRPSSSPPSSAPSTHWPGWRPRLDGAARRLAGVEQQLAAMLGAAAAGVDPLRTHPRSYCLPVPRARSAEPWSSRSRPRASPPSCRRRSRAPRTW